MNSRIEQIVGLYFDDIPYDESITDAQEKIRQALDKELSALTENGMREDEAVEELMVKYPRLSDMAGLAGISPEEAAKWRSGDDAVELKPVKKLIFAQRRSTYAVAVFSVFAFDQLLWTVYNAIKLNYEFFFTLLYMAFWCYLVFRSLRKLIKREKEGAGTKYDTEAFMYLRTLSDKYSKRLLNSIALIFAAVFIFTVSEISFYVFGNSKSAELEENFFSNLFMVQIPLMILIKNILLHTIIKRRINLPEKEKFKKHLVGITIFSAVFWLAVTIFTIAMSGTLMYPANVFLVSGILFFILIVVYNVSLRRKVTFRNIVFNPRRFSLIVSVVLVVSVFTVFQRDTFYTQPYINSVPVIEHNTHKIDYNEETGVYTITSSTEDFKVLHLTDIHLGGSLYSYRKDIKALEACYKELEYTKPDLVIVTGDLSFPLGIMSMSLNNFSAVYQFSAFMRNTGIPWAFTYGNHDTESLASMNKQELNEVYKALSYKTSGNLLYPYVQPDIMGRNNQLIELRNSDGSLNTGFFLIDSNAYTGEGINVYDYIHDDQVDWYKSEVERMNAEAGHTVNSLVFFHIPLQQYRTAYELYEDGSDEVKYFFGENGEQMIDKVCCSDYPSKLFDTAKELGSTTGFFCGHDHYNNMSLEYEGIRLTYGMSIDYLAMPGIEKDTAQRGAELITIHSDSSWDLEQIPLTSIE